MDLSFSTEASPHAFSYIYIEGVQIFFLSNWLFLNVAVYRHSCWIVCTIQKSKNTNVCIWKIDMCVNHVQELICKSLMFFFFVDLSTVSKGNQHSLAKTSYFAKSSHLHFNSHERILAMLCHGWQTLMCAWFCRVIIHFFPHDCVVLDNISRCLPLIIG